MSSYPLLGSGSLPRIGRTIVPDVHLERGILGRALDDVSPLLHRLQKSRIGAVTQVDNNVIVRLSEPNEPEVSNNVIVKTKSDSSAPAIEDREPSESASSPPEHQGALDPDRKLIEAGFTGLGLMTWESTLNNCLPLLNLPPDVLEVLRIGEIEYTLAKAIAQIKDEIERAACLKEASLTVANLALASIELWFGRSR